MLSFEFQVLAGTPVVSIRDEGPRRPHAVKHHLSRDLGLRPGASWRGIRPEKLPPRAGSVSGDAHPPPDSRPRLTGLSDPTACLGSPQWVPRRPGIAAWA